MLQIFSIKFHTLLRKFLRLVFAVWRHFQSFGGLPLCTWFFSAFTRGFNHKNYLDNNEQFNNKLRHSVLFNNSEQVYLTSAFVSTTHQCILNAPNMRDKSVNCWSFYTQGKKIFRALITMIYERRLVKLWVSRVPLT